MADQQPAAKPRSRIRLVVQVVVVVVSLVLVVASFHYLVQASIWARWGGDPGETRIEDVSLVVIAAWNLATYALVWMTFSQPEWSHS